MKIQGLKRSVFCGNEMVRTINKRKWFFKVWSIYYFGDLRTYSNFTPNTKVPYENQEEKSITLNVKNASLKNYGLQVNLYH